MIRTDDLLAASTVRAHRKGSPLLTWALFFAFLLAVPGWTGIAAFLVGKLLWDVWRHRVRRPHRLRDTLSTSTPHLRGSGRVRTASLTAAAWAHAEPGVPVATERADDAEVVVWRRTEWDAVLAAVATPLALLAFVALARGIPTLLTLADAVLPAGLPPLGPLESALLFVAPIALAMLGRHRLFARLERRLDREDHLLLRNRQAVLVDGEVQQRFSLDDVTRIDTTRHDVHLVLLDGRTLTLRTTVPDALAAVLQDRVGTVASTEVPEDVRRLSAIRRPEAQR
jgi:hypothetical protein